MKELNMRMIPSAYFICLEVNLANTPNPVGRWVNLANVREINDFGDSCWIEYTDNSRLMVKGTARERLIEELNKLQNRWNE